MRVGQRLADVLRKEGRPCADADAREPVDELHVIDGGRPGEAARAERSFLDAENVERELHKVARQHERHCQQAGEGEDEKRRRRPAPSRRWRAEPPLPQTVEDLSAKMLHRLRGSCREATEGAQRITPAVSYCAGDGAGVAGGADPGVTG